MTYEHEAVMEAVTEAALNLLPSMMQSGEDRIQMAKVLRAEVARRLAPVPSLPSTTEQAA